MDRRPSSCWPVPLRVALACAATVLLTTACHTPRETGSVHLPLAAGNRWVYDVTSDSSHGTAVLAVTGLNKDGYGLSISCDCGHLSEPDTLLRLRCRDTVLWLLSAVERNGRVWWASVLSDDPSDSCTQTLLLYRLQSGSVFSAQPVGAVVVGEDTFPDCLRLSCRRAHEDFALFFGGGDTTWVSEDYAPGIGIVRMEAEQHWWSWGAFLFSYADSGTWVDRWELREYSLAE